MTEGSSPPSIYISSLTDDLFLQYNNEYGQSVEQVDWNHTYDSSLEFLSKEKNKRICIVNANSKKDYEHVKEILKLSELQALDVNVSMFIDDMDHPEYDMTKSDVSAMTRTFLEISVAEVESYIAETKEKKAVFLQYDDQEDDDESPKWYTLSFGRGWCDSFRSQIMSHENNLFEQFIESLKALKNRDLEVHVILYAAEFDKLFAAMKWKFDTKMVEWQNERIRTHIKKRKFKGDSNTYRFDCWLECYDWRSNDENSENGEPVAKKSRTSLNSSDFVPSVPPAAVTSHYVFEDDSVLQSSVLSGLSDASIDSSIHLNTSPCDPESGLNCDESNETSLSGR